MLTHFLKRFTTIAIGATLSVPASAEESAPNPNKEVMLCTLNEMNVRYTEKDGNILFLVDSNIVVIDCNAERQTLTVTSYNRLEIPQEKRAEAYSIVNKLNIEYNTQFCIDEDGDLKVQLTFDIDDMTISPKVAESSVHRVLAGLAIGTKKLKHLAGDTMTPTPDTPGN